MPMRSLALLALLLAPATAEDELGPLPGDPSIAAHVLAGARKDLKTARDDFKALSPDERGVIKTARQAVARTAEAKALAPALGAAADLLDGASSGNGPDAELCGQMAKSYRAMADELDKDESYLSDEMRGKTPAERADATFAEAEKFLAAAVDGTPGEQATTALECLKRSDPLWRALALNTKTLARGYATLAATEHDEKLAAAVAKAAKLQKALEPFFAGIRTSKRDEPAPAPPPPPAPRRLNRYGG